MTATEIIESLKHLSTPERLVVIETASRLIREDIEQPKNGDSFERDCRMRAAALTVKDFYEAQGELTAWTDLDGEMFLEDYLDK